MILPSDLHMSDSSHVEQDSGQGTSLNTGEPETLTDLLMEMKQSQLVVQTSQSEDLGIPWIVDLIEAYQSFDKVRMIFVHCEIFIEIRLLNFGGISRSKNNFSCCWKSSKSMATRGYLKKDSNIL